MAEGIASGLDTADLGELHRRRPYSALAGRAPLEAYRAGAGPWIGWTHRYAPCPHLHRRYNSRKEITEKGFWRHDRRSENTLAKPPSCPTNRDRLGAAAAEPRPSWSLYMLLRMIRTASARLFTDALCSPALCCASPLSRSPFTVDFWSALSVLLLRAASMALTFFGQ